MANLGLIPNLSKSIESTESLRLVALMRHLPRKRPDFAHTPTLEEIWALDASILPESWETGRRIADTYLQGVEFAFHAHSRAVRCYESIQAVRHRDIAWAEAPELLPDSIEEWAFQSALKTNSVVAVVPAAPALLRREGEKIWRYVQEMASVLGNGQAALLCSHHPVTEAAVAAAYGIWTPLLRDLGEGDIVVFAFSRNDVFVSADYLPVPPKPAS